MEDEFVKKLREKYERGEISKEIYEDILARYTSEMKGGEGEITDVEKGDMEVGAAEEQERNRGAYRCAGSCVLGPGKYEYISAAGSIRITGDVEAGRISSAGSLVAEGNVKADKMKCEGSSMIKGDVKVDTITASGSFSANKLRADVAKLAGGISVKSIVADEIRIGGVVKADEIRGDSVWIRLSKSRSKVGRIVGDSINIACERRLFGATSGHLEAQEIRGDRITLDCTTAEVVEGDEVKVGDNCKIDRLIADTMTISTKAKVKEVVRK